MGRVYVFSSAAFNYIPKVRMLFQSLRKYHPEFRLCLALADTLHEHHDLSSEPIDEILPLSELGIPHWEGWAFCHDIVELSTAIKPFALQKLLSRPDCSGVLYLDPDMVAFSRLDEILQEIERSSLVLTPHQTVPESSLEAIMDNEICSLKHGIYNLGFIGVSATDEGRRFAEWWSDRVYHFCRADIPNGLFTDQRWIDLAPVFFRGVTILRSCRYNVAPWNLTTREVRGNLEDGFTVNGEPLGLYHFTGFDSGAHHTMAEKNSSGNPSIMELVGWYKKQIKRLSREPLARVPWSYGMFASGKKISRAQRIVYRERVDLQQAFPTPFDDSGKEGYLSWWNAQSEKEYPQLYEGRDDSEALKSITSSLSPGFRGTSAGEGQWDPDVVINRGSFVKNTSKRLWNMFQPKSRRRMNSG